MEIILLAVVILLLASITGLYLVHVQIKQVTLTVATLVQQKQELHQIPELANIMSDLKSAGYSVIRIDPDSVFIRNRTR